MTWNIPNILTVFRLIAAPAVLIALAFLARPYGDWVALCLFIGAAVTDFLDGYLARKWNQQSKFGAMLDPIADKAMVVIALVAVAAMSQLAPLIAIPAALIIFREVFVSGLREFLGADAGRLAVTKLAKWKTTVQMVAIAVLFARPLFDHYLGMQTLGMDGATVEGIIDGTISDEVGLRWKYYGLLAGHYGGIILINLAAALTLITGWDYFAKSLPFLREVK